MNILIVANCFAPSAEVGAKRPTGLAIELAGTDHTPFVVTLANQCYLRTDASRQVPELERIQTLRTPCRSLWHHSRKWRTATHPISRATLIAGQTLSKLTARFCRLDVLNPWAHFSAGASAKFAIKHKIDLIWATVPNFASAVLAQKISNRTRIPFVIDYRDLLDPDDQSETMRLRRKLEESVLRDCSGISYVAPQQINTLEKQYPFIQSRPRQLAYNFFEPSTDMSSMPDSEAVSKLVYGGSLYGGQRRVQGLIAALSPKSELDNPSLVFEFFGSQPDQDHVRSIASDLDLDNSVQTHEHLTQSEFDQRCRQAAIQLLVVGHGRRHEETIPAKLYDYFRAGRPILVIGPKGCDAGRLTEQVNRGIAVADDDTEGIKRALNQLLNGQNSAGTNLDMSDSATQRFSRPVVMHELLDLFSKVIDPKGHADPS